MNTTYFVNLLAGNIFNTKTTPAVPSKYYLGLSTTAPNINGTGVTEVSTSGTGYKRMELTGLSVPTGGVVKNATDISFPRSVTDWGTLSYFVVYDAVTGGNLLSYGDLAKVRIVQSDSILLVEANGVTLTVV